MALQYKQGFCKQSTHNGNNNNPGCQELLIQKYPQLEKAFSRSPDEVEEMLKFIPETKIIINGAK
ncbi:MAG: hypothetical protein A2W23_03435 [Planctomycetes bacterium RBG_16_43_13]|nr:MAG: hypothetical protein A2W23_03435 [Planctomycetes bacterium RBG_16_43_13]